MIGVVLALSAVLSILMTALVFPMLHSALPESLYLKLCTSSSFIRFVHFVRFVQHRCSAAIRLVDHVASHRAIEPSSHRSISGRIMLITAGLLAYPLAVLFCPVLWALHRADTGSLGVAAWAVLVAQMIIRRTGDFAAT
jgi:hypothetical protein